MQVEIANSRLRTAEREKFGKATTAPSVASSLEPTSTTEFDSFVEKIDGDHATVSTPRVPATSMEFIRVNGKWKLPIASLVGKLDSTIADTMGAATAAQIQIIDALTAEVKAGTLTSEEQVRAELAKRLEARIAATRAATQPATHPATAPAAAPVAPPAAPPAPVAPAAAPAPTPAPTPAPAPAPAPAAPAAPVIPVAAPAAPAAPAPATQPAK